MIENNSILQKDGNVVIVPLDHGVHDGPIDGLVDMEKTLKLLIEEGVDAVVLHKGMYWKYRHLLKKTKVLIHISASTNMGNWLRKVLVTSVEEVATLKAAGVSIHVNMGNKYEPEMLADFGKVVAECRKYKLPLLAMMYVRDDARREIINFTNVEKIKHAARVAAELGADIIKVPYTGSLETFRDVVNGSPIPIVVAGGTVNTNDTPILETIQNVMKAGGRGVSMGRHIFQNKDVKRMLRDVKKIVHPK